MYKYRFILLLLVIVGCSRVNENKIESNSTINLVFNKSEIKDMAIILDFFNEQICNDSDANSSELIGCYKIFFEEIEKNIVTGEIKIDIPYDEQVKMYNKINESTFNEIWRFGWSWYRDSPDTLKMMDINYNGKYLNFLYELSKDDEVIQKYYENFISAHNISATVVERMIRDYGYNFKDIRVQLVIAIHYLTLNDNFNRREKY